MRAPTIAAPAVRAFPAGCATAEETGAEFLCGLSRHCRVKDEHATSGPPHADAARGGTGDPQQR
jgi:hypothetical protein